MPRYSDLRRCGSQVAHPTPRRPTPLVVEDRFVVRDIISTGPQLGSTPANR
ncbi:MAG: hypothetical protein ABGZ17_13795 [Planctomycetaceae bacterium]